MQIVADLHLHSKYSRAVSQQMILPEMAKWAKRKGIDLLGTGDFTHPLWFRELKSQLEEVGGGVYKLKSQNAKVKSTSQNSKVEEKESLFLLSTEISSIYSQGGSLRRIHNLIFAPSLEVVEKINAALLKRGANLMSDGRPIIGLSARDLTELVLGVDDGCLIIPAHAWTPWFSLYGSESGFDSIDECFGEMAEYIYAVETGLSSSPEMNWRISELDGRAIISFSDAHSGAKLGREATVFELDKLTFENIRRAILGQSGKGVGVGENQTGSQTPKPQTIPKIRYTLEFYPEEGKYHYTGHRNCQVRQSPEETQKLGRVCPVCGKPLTVGVMHRVEQLAKLRIKPFGFAQGEGEKLKVDEFGVRWIENPTQDRSPYVMLVPLLEIIAESLGSLPASQKVINEYNNLTDRFGSEFGVLLKTPLAEIAKISGEKMAEGIERVRGGQIVVEPGYDGEYGIVKIWPTSSDSVNQNKAPEERKQMTLF